MPLLPFLSRPGQGAKGWFPVREAYDDRLQENITRSFDEATLAITAASNATSAAAGATTKANDAQTKADAAAPATRLVNGKPLTADITLAKADIGLGNVSNTADADKPVSTPQQTALDAKAPKATAPVWCRWTGSAWVANDGSAVPTSADVVRIYDSSQYASGVTTPTHYSQLDKWYRKAA